MDLFAIRTEVVIIILAGIIGIFFNIINNKIHNKMNVSIEPETVNVDCVDENKILDISKNLLHPKIYIEVSGVGNKFYIDKGLLTKNKIAVAGVDNIRHISVPEHSILHIDISGVDNKIIISKDLKHITIDEEINGVGSRIIR